MIGHDINLDYKVKESVNTRKYLVGLMEKLSQKLMSDKEDDTNALKIVVNILETIMLNYSITEEAFDLNTGVDWNAEERELNINVLELKAVLLALKVISNKISHCHVRDG